jgi:hypothetical protein
MSFLSVFQEFVKRDEKFQSDRLNKTLLAISLDIIAYDRFSIMEPFYLSVS